MVSTSFLQGGKNDDTIFGGSGDDVILGDGNVRLGQRQKMTSDNYFQK